MKNDTLENNKLTLSVRKIREELTRFSMGELKVLETIKEQMLCGGLELPDGPGTYEEKLDWLIRKLLTDHNPIVIKKTRW